MSEWIEYREGMALPHPDALIEVEYEAVRSTRLTAGTNWAGARRYRVVREAPADERIAALERRIEELERKQSVRVIAPAPVWVSPAYTVGEEHPSVQGIVPPIV